MNVLRRTPAILLSVLLCLSPLLPARANQDYRTAVFTISSKTALVNGRNMAMDLAPFVDPASGRTYVPVRYLAQALGAAVAWDPVNRTVVLTAPGHVVALTVGSPVLVVNGQALSMDAVPQIVPPGRTVLPVRWVAAAFGFQVNWVPALQQAYVTNVPPPQLSTGS